MSDDLISRSQVLKEIRKMKPSLGRYLMEGIVRNQPTAFDVDKVVVELEEMARECDDRYEMIDVVKRGGVKC